MFCKFCGAENQNDAAFCSSCGAQLSSIVIGQSAFDSSTIGNFAGSIVMIFVNRSYYKNRADMFIN